VNDQQLGISGISEPLNKGLILGGCRQSGGGEKISCKKRVYMHD
jgi:hypothetical protein